MERTLHGVARLVLVLGLLAGAAPVARAAPLPIIAVFEIDGQASGAKKALTRALTDELRVRLTATKQFVVIDKTEQEAALARLVTEQKKASYAACVDEACQIPLGKELAANRILRTKLNRFDQTWVLSAELVDLATGGAVGAASIESDGSESQLLSAVESLVRELAGPAAGNVAATTRGLGSLPPLSGKLAPGGAVALDVDADLLVAYDAALKADRDGAKSPGAAAAAWSAVAAHKGKNPYKVDAAKRAKEWLAFEKKEKELDAQRAKDLENLKKVLPLESLAAATKSELVKRYRDTYGVRGLASILPMVPPGPIADGLCAALVGAEDYPPVKIKVSRTWSWDIELGAYQLKVGELVVTGEGADGLTGEVSVRLPPCPVRSIVTTKLGHDHWVILSPPPAGEKIVLALSRFISAGGRGCRDAPEGCRDVQSGLSFKDVGFVAHDKVEATCAALGPKWRVPTFAETTRLTEPGWTLHGAREDGYAPASIYSEQSWRGAVWHFFGDEWTLGSGEVLSADTCGVEMPRAEGGYSVLPGRRTRRLQPSGPPARECATSARLFCVSGTEIRR